MSAEYDALFSERERNRLNAVKWERANRPRPVAPLGQAGELLTMEIADYLQQQPPPAPPIVPGLWSEWLGRKRSERLLS